MVDYDLTRLGTREFEHLVQALALRVLGAKVEVFGDGRDGGREATFDGRTHYPDPDAPWDGYGVLQAKFHQRPRDPAANATWLCAEVKAEAEQWLNRRRSELGNTRRPKYMIFATNVVLSAVPGSGGIDKVKETLRSVASSMGLHDWALWHHDQICRFLDGHADIRRAYAAFTTPGDVLAKLAEPPSPPLLNTELAVAADRLAIEVASQWAAEADHRRLRVPMPVPIRWQWAKGMTSTVGVVANVPPRRRPLFPPLPGVSAVGPAGLRSGGLRDLFSVYAGLDGGRTVILGDAGSGKSAATILTLIEALAHRAGLAVQQRAAVPVPVLFTTSGWDPGDQRLGEWLAERLAVDHPFLRAEQFGDSMAAQLVKSGGVALFLDGFDEMDPRLRAAALDDIRKPSTFRLVLATRTREFADAVITGEHVHAAAALELLPVPAADAADYLDGLNRDDTAPQWTQLTAHLRGHPDSVVAHTLDSPLTLTLLRDHTDADLVRDLLTPGRFNVREEVENALLDRSVGAGEHRALLTFVAARMLEQDNTRDLAWWQIHWWVKRWHERAVRVSVPAVIGVVLGAVFGPVMFGPHGRYVVDGSTGAAFGLVYLSAIGLVFGLLTGLMSELRHSRRFARASGNTAAFSLGAAVTTGVATVIAVGNQTHWGLGVLAGLGAGVVIWRGPTGAAAPLRTGERSRWRSLASRFHPLSGLAGGLPIGLAYGFTDGPRQGIGAGLTMTFVFGVMVGFGRPSMQTATDPYVAWVQDVKRAITFGLTCGLALGVPLGLKQGVLHGPLAGAITFAAITVMVGLSLGIGSCDAWRTTLVCLQLRLRGIRIRGVSSLEAERDRRVLRTVGTLYQFKHPRLQDRLVDERSAG
ncbi:hypothetical protein FHX81_2321 [Saccharothrix saharensis]|uniref:NACHT domain-containing protein n=1 Tax=Saccharothrix saharensis TaxID=571190 RepID=A0A543JAY3_9PSEU|nr:hypothetical protein [Saccharothrix saharensis]TQM80000.1 hypothetical protein FHX81_2321 [Saccharothrix saharensis]